MPFPVSFQLSLLRRMIAAGGAALVLLLSVAAVSPAVHAWLHGQGDDEAHACEQHHDHGAPAGPEDPGCSVTLFGAGVLTLVTWQFPGTAWVVYPELCRRVPAARLTVEPRYRHVPSHAPPVH